MSLKQSAINNQNGFSLINMMVGLGIAAIVGVSFMAAMQLMTRTKKAQDVKTEASLFIDTVQQLLKRTETCKKNLAANQIKMDGSEADVAFSGYTKDSDLAPGITIKKLSMKTLGKSIKAPGAAGMRTVNASLEVSIWNTSVNPPLPLRSRYIPLIVTVDAGDLITGCGSVDASAQVCQQLDGVWDPSAPVGLQCVPTDRCLYAGSYTLAPASGKDANGAPNPGFLNTYTSAQSCPQYFSAQQTGSVQVARKASKYKVVTDTYPVFTCVRCQTPVADQSSLSPSTDELDPAGNADIEQAFNTGDSDASDIKKIRDTLGLPSWLQ